MTDKDLAEMKSNIAVINEADFVESCAEVSARLLCQEKVEFDLMTLMAFTVELSHKLFHKEEDEKDGD